MTKNVRFLKDLTVDCIDEHDASDCISYKRGDIRNVLSVVQQSDSFVNIELSVGILLLDVPRSAVIIEG
jgi:hypothetical protein